MVFALLDDTIWHRLSKKSIPEIVQPGSSYIANYNSDETQPTRRERSAQILPGANIGKYCFGGGHLQYVIVHFYGVYVIKKV